MAARGIGKAQSRRISSLIHFGLRAFCDFVIANGRIGTVGVIAGPSTEATQMETQMESPFVPLDNNEFFIGIGG
jgi:hypothetical protein